MAVYVIGYDIHPSQGQTYTNLEKAIKAEAVGGWWHKLDSTWLIVSSKSAQAVRDAIWVHMFSNDKLLVVRATLEMAWNGFDKDASNWILQNYNR